MERESFCARMFPDMVEIYKSGGISGLCLQLQQDFDADVPVFLICLMADRAGHGLSDPEFTAWVASAASWRETVIKPLRSVRVTLKPLTVNEPLTAFRERIKSVELEAEKLHVEALAAAFAPGSGAGDLAPRYLFSLGMEPEMARARLAQFTGPKSTGESMN